MQKFTYHSHTKFSDGYNTIEEMLAKACDLGFEEYGITDHFIHYKDIEKSRSWESFLSKTKIKDFLILNFEQKLDYIKKCVEYINKISKQFPIKVFCGLEVDYFFYDGWSDDFNRLKKESGCNYFISGNHYAYNKDGLDLLDFIEFQTILNNKDLEIEYLVSHFNGIKKAVESQEFKFIAHLDMVKDFYDISHPLIQNALNETIDIIIKYKMPIEFSTRRYQQLNHFYPSNEILIKLRDGNVPIVISDDAHNIDMIGQFFSEAEEELKKLNYTNHFRMKL